MKELIVISRRMAAISHHLQRHYPFPKNKYPGFCQGKTRDDSFNLQNIKMISYHRLLSRKAFLDSTSPSIVEQWFVRSRV